MSSNQKLSCRNAILSKTGSAVAMAMLIQTFGRELFPFHFKDLKSFSLATLQKLFTHLLHSSQITMVIDEFNDLSPNQIFSSAEAYLSSKSLTTSKRFRISKGEKDKDYTLSTEKIEEMAEVFEGVKMKWKLVTALPLSFSPHSGNRSEIRSFELTFHKKHKDKVLDSYLPHILEVSKAFKEENRVLKLYTTRSEGSSSYMRGQGPWKAINLNHSASFETLAMEDALKKTIVDDLSRFVARKDYYRRVGKAWKRGYLLYGPPGTGKSSLIAAMANYLKFDIYDLELTDLRCNSDYRRILVSTGNKSILVVEDIDCSLDFQNSRRLSNKYPEFPDQVDLRQMTLSGMLNFMDGLWSSCGDERIIVFTTNNKERLDPALLRPGRMDMHIHMSYCTPCGFKLLVNNYLQVSDHPTFEEIGKLLETTNVTPAEVAETLMLSDDPNTTLAGLVGFLHEKQLGDKV